MINSYVVCVNLFRGVQRSSEIRHCMCATDISAGLAVVVGHLMI